MANLNLIGHGWSCFIVWELVDRYGCFFFWLKGKPKETPTIFAGSTKKRAPSPIQKPLMASQELASTIPSAQAALRSCLARGGAGQNDHFLRCVLCLFVRPRFRSAKAKRGNEALYGLMSLQGLKAQESSWQSIRFWRAEDLRG